MSELPSASARLRRGPSTLPSLGEGPATLGTNREGLAEPPSYHLTVREDFTERFGPLGGPVSRPERANFEATVRGRKCGCRKDHYSPG